MKKKLATALVIFFGEEGLVNFQELYRMDTPYYIDLQIKNVAELLLPPGSPSFCKRQLNADTEEYIIEEAMNFPAKGTISLRIQVANQAEQTDEEIRKAIHTHFKYCGECARKMLAANLQKGWRSLLAAIIFLVIMIILSSLLGHILPAGSFFVTVREILVILGWVALWRPAELLLYEWRPQKKDITLFKRLEQAGVEIITSSK